MYRKLTSVAAFACLLSTPSLAQTAVGTGVGVSEANSASGAIAVNRGNGNSSSNLTVVNPANTTSTVNSNLSGTTTSNVNQTLSGTTTSNINQSGTTTQNINQSGGTTSRVIASGTTTVRTAPSMVAPGLAAAGLETCLGSASGTVSAIGFGIGGGSTYADEGCQARLDSRTLYAYGLKAAAVARLCQRADIWRSMPDMCQQYWPAGVPLPAGIVVAAPLVAPPPGTYMSTSPGAVVRVINGRTGIEGDCLNYDARRQKCHYWLGDPPPKKPRHAKALKPLATAHAAVNPTPVAEVGPTTKDH